MTDKMPGMIDSISILFGVVTFFYIVRLNDLNELLKYDYNYVRVIIKSCGLAKIA